jgi:hypothetical protein
VSLFLSFFAFLGQRLLFARRSRSEFQKLL